RPDRRSRRSGGGVAGGRSAAGRGPRRPAGERLPDRRAAVRRGGVGPESHPRIRPLSPGRLAVAHGRSRGRCGGRPGGGADGPRPPRAPRLPARGAAGAGDPGTAMAFYRRFLDRYPEHWESPGARFGLAELLEATGQGEEAQRLFRSIWLTAPLSFAANAARD